PIAPKFNVVCKPNDWSKTVAAGAAQVEKESLTDAKRLQFEFWTMFRSHVEEHGQRIKATKPYPQHWMNFALGKSWFRLCAIALPDRASGADEGGELRAEVYSEGPTSKAQFAALETGRAGIEAEVGEPLTWHNPAGKKACRVYLRRAATLTD